MGPFGNRRGGGGERSQEDAVRDRQRLPHVLHELHQQAGAAGGRVVQLQPVIQFCGASRYPSWARGWQSAWHAARVPDPRVVWPDLLPHDHTAALLVPVPPGRVGLAIGRHPVPQVLPLLAHAVLPDAVDASDFALNLMLHWIDTRPPGQTLQLAPPVLEYTRSGRVERRVVERYGQAWSLPAPDGV